MVVSAMLLVAKRLSHPPPDALNVAAPTVTNVLASERTRGKRLRIRLRASRRLRRLRYSLPLNGTF